MENIVNWINLFFLFKIILSSFLFINKNLVQIIFDNYHRFAINFIYFKFVKTIKTFSSNFYNLFFNNFHFQIFIFLFAILKIFSYS